MIPNMPRNNRLVAHTHTLRVSVSNLRGAASKNWYQQFQPPWILGGVQDWRQISKLPGESWLYERNPACRDRSDIVMRRPKGAKDDATIPAQHIPRLFHSPSTAYLDGRMCGEGSRFHKTCCLPQLFNLQSQPWAALAFRHSHTSTGKWGQCGCRAATLDFFCIYKIAVGFNPPVCHSLHQHGATWNDKLKPIEDIKKSKNWLWKK